MTSGKSGGDVVSTVYPVLEITDVEVRVEFKINKMKVTQGETPPYSGIGYESPPVEVPFAEFCEGVTEDNLRLMKTYLDELIINTVSNKLKETT